ncbi:hypothetical protein KP509_28G019000 [Ceratopteris richardii]|uniref:BTB domain-containing protein n=1 Tax=Ceratopteris richardii TaxID=49495 RepID=A0A8T2RA09_CERRI|nr:hypothetical protein KP509_28G019000 [Ceratopteris richardii]
MELELVNACGSQAMAPSTNFAFAFNDSNFSDRVLRIEIMAGSGMVKAEDGATSIADWARDRKRRRADAKKDTAVETALDYLEGQEEHIIDESQQIADEYGLYHSLDEMPVAMDESATQTSSPVGDEHSSESEFIVKVKTLHVSSAILAAESPFFYKLFSNGMRESEQRYVTLQTNTYEEAALMDMLQFIYTGRLQASSASALLDVLMVSDKYEVASCMRHCSRLLRNLPMTSESALLYLDLPSSVLLAEAMQPLTDAAMSFLVSQYKDILRYQEEVLNLPLSGIEALLSSDDLQVPSEDNVFEFVLKWAKSHYPKADERKEILSTRLIHLVRFPMMSARKLKKVLASPELDHTIVSSIVLEALFYKAESSHKQRQLAMEETRSRKYTERSYKYRPVKFLEFESPHRQCIVYLDLKREECAALFPQGRVYSQAFHLGGQGFFLSAHCNMDQHSAFHCFGLFLGMQEKGSVSSSVDYEFGCRHKPNKDFTVKYKGTYRFTGGKAVGFRNLFSLPWSCFIAEDSPYFINNMLHLRAELIIRPE